MSNKRDKQIVIRNGAAEFLTFSYQSGGDEIAVRVENENVWLTQKLMGKLFDCTQENIQFHLKNIFDSGELNENSVTKEYLATAADGKNYRTKFYNLEAIISVGYRVNSNKAISFRQWATKILKQFTTHGYVLDKQRLKNGVLLDEDYYEKLLEDIREIRLSERRFYQKITDIYATALDYDAESEKTMLFYKTVQNKLHWAIHQHTAAELIYDRANANKEYMGLTTWEQSPKGKIRKSDVTVAKNYLSVNEMQALERIVNAYLDLAEDYASRRIPLTMDDWKKHLDRVLQNNGRELLNNAGRISTEIAKEHAESEFEKYRIIQDRNFKSDFDKMVLADGLDELEKQIKRKKDNKQS